MKYKAVFFDLDGTLLPMDQDVFVRDYFSRLARKLAPLGYESKTLLAAIWDGTAAMMKNNGESTNEACFRRSFTAAFGEDARRDEPVFADFYANEFQLSRAVCGFDPGAAACVRAVRELGLRVVLATSPLFPAVATESRIRWAGLEPSDFELYTTYEHCRYAKPNPAYYREVLEKTGLRGEECLMVGNDVREDGAAAALGMDVFLIPACLINRDALDISGWPQGDFDDLLTFIKHS